MSDNRKAEYEPLYECEQLPAGKLALYLLFLLAILIIFFMCQPYTSPAWLRIAGFVIKTYWLLIFLVLIPWLPYSRLRLWPDRIELHQGIFSEFQIPLNEIFVVRALSKEQFREAVKSTVTDSWVPGKTGGNSAWCDLSATDAEGGLAIEVDGMGYYVGCKNPEEAEKAIRDAMALVGPVTHQKNNDYIFSYSSGNNYQAALVAFAVLLFIFGTRVSGLILRFNSETPGTGEMIGTVIGALSPFLIALWVASWSQIRIRAAKDRIEIDWSKWRWHHEKYTKDQIENIEVLKSYSSWFPGNEYRFFMQVDGANGKPMAAIKIAGQSRGFAIVSDDAQYIVQQLKSIYGI
jgi:hypothetical protein